MAVEQHVETRTPLALRSNSVKHVVQQGQDDEDPVVRNGTLTMPIRIVRDVWHRRLDRQLPIPQSGVMRTDVSDVVQRLEPRAHRVA